MERRVYVIQLYAIYMLRENWITLYFSPSLLHYSEVGNEELWPVLSEDRVIGVETGGCPHTAIREDASMNFEALEELKGRFDDLDIIFLESGGDNLAATFSPDLVDFSIYIIDVAQGEKIPRRI